MQSAALHIPIQESFFRSIQTDMPRVLRNHRASVSLTASEKKDLERIADKSGLSVSRVIQEAVGEFIARHGGKKLKVIGNNRQGK